MFQHCSRRTRNAPQGASWRSIRDTKTIHLPPNSCNCASSVEAQSMVAASSASLASGRVPWIGFASTLVGLFSSFLEFRKQRRQQDSAAEFGASSATAWFSMVYFLKYFLFRFILPLHNEQNSLLGFCITSLTSDFCANLVKAETSIEVPSVDSSEPCKNNGSVTSVLIFCTIWWELSRVGAREGEALARDTWSPGFLEDTSKAPSSGIFWRSALVELLTPSVSN